MTMLRTVLDWLLHGGSFRLRAYEKALLERSAAELKDREAEVLRSQIQQVARVKRTGGVFTIGRADETTHSSVDNDRSNQHAFDVPFRACSTRNSARPSARDA